MRKIILFLVIIFSLFSMNQVKAENFSGGIRDSGMFVEQIDENYWHMEVTNGGELGYKYTGKGIKIAILDSGVNPHESFIKNDTNKVKKQIRCEENGCKEEEFLYTGQHGTSVAGVIISEFNGVAKDAEIYSVYLEKEESIMPGWTPKMTPETLKTALRWSIDNKMDIINISQGEKEDLSHIIAGVGFTENQIKEIDELIQEATDKGIQIIAAAGNTEIEKEKGYTNYPARNVNVIAVGGIDYEIRENGKYELNRFIDERNNLESSYSKHIAIAAPARIVVPYGVGSAVRKDLGTSLASPLVAGIFAQLKEKYPTIESYNREFPNDTVTTKRALNIRLYRLMIENAIPMNGYAEDPIGFGDDWEYGNGLVQAPPYNVQKELNLKGRSYYLYKEPNEKGKTNELLKINTVTSFQKWYDWHKIKDKSGEFVWIKLDESVGEIQETNNELPTVVYPYQSIAQYMYKGGGYTDYIEGGDFVLETKFKDIDYKELQKKYTYYPKEEVYKYYRLMALGDFYDETEKIVADEVLAFQRKICQMEEEKMGEYYSGCSAEWAAESPHSRGKITDVRLDYKNIYNLVLENSKGETYFVPIISSARFKYDIENQFFGPKTNDYVYQDGEDLLMSRKTSVQAILPQDGFEIFDFRGLYYSGDLWYGEVSYKELGKKNILEVLVNKLDPEKTQNLKLKDVIYNKIDTIEQNPEEPIVEIPNKNEINGIYRTDYFGNESAYVNFDGTIDWEGGLVGWYQEAKYKDITFEKMNERYDYHPSKDVHEYFRKMGIGNFYDDPNLINERRIFLQKFLEINGFNDYGFVMYEPNEIDTHHFANVDSYKRVDQINVYNVILKDLNEKTYFVPIISQSTISFDIEEQFIRIKSANFFDIEGRNSPQTYVCWLSPNSDFKVFDLDGVNNLLLYHGLTTDPPLSELNVLNKLKEELGRKDLELVDVQFEKVN